jgi:hypothetical protein
LKNKFLKEKRGNVVQYIIVLAFILVIFFFFTSKMKPIEKDMTEKTENGIEQTLDGI